MHSHSLQSGNGEGIGEKKRIRDLGLERLPKWNENDRDRQLEGIAYGARMMDR